MTTNDITGDKIQTKPTTDAYRNGYDHAFANVADRQYVVVRNPNGSTFRDRIIYETGDDIMASSGTYHRRKHIAHYGMLIIYRGTRKEVDKFMRY